MFLSGVPYSHFSAHDFIAMSPSSSVLPEDTSKCRQEVHHLPLFILNWLLRSFYYTYGMPATPQEIWMPRIGPIQTIGINRINSDGT